MIEALLNGLTDLDWGWWPFLRLRPARHEAMSSARVALMSVLFCPLYAAGALVLMTGLGWNPLGGVLPTFSAILLESMVAFFVVYRLTFAVAWNRRARRSRVSEAVG